MPVNQMSGVHLMAPQMVSMLSFTEVKDYDDLIARYRKLPTAFEQTIENMRKGMAEGLIPPKFLLEKVAGQAAGLAGMPPEASPFAGPLASFPEGIPAEEQQRIREEMLAAIRDEIIPAYEGFTEFVRDEYAPAGREEPGMWSLPDGEERYAFLVKVQTTSDLTPEEIHEIGLAEVEALEEEMRQVASSLGYDDLESFNAALEEMPELRPQSREEILEIYRGHIDAMYEKLPQLFGRLPHGDAVRRLEAGQEWSESRDAILVLSAEEACAATDFEGRAVLVSDWTRQPETVLRSCLEALGGRLGLRPVYPGLFER